MAEYVLKVLDAAAPGYEVYAIDPPTEVGAWCQAYSLEEMKDLVRRKASDGGSW